MQCRTHPDRNGVNTCNQCGEWLCEECTVEINGRIFCRKCLAQLASAPKPEASAPRAAIPCAGMPKRHISWGLLFIFSSLPPGVNYMYEGLIKRGLAAMSGFFTLVFLASMLSEVSSLSLIIGLSFPVYILACIFDSFHIRRRINAGEAVSDDIDDIIAFFTQNKRLILCAAALLVVIALFNSVLSVLPWAVKRLLPMALVGLGLYMLLRGPACRKDGKGNPDDTRRDNEG
ncbi:MAG: hypothetical protein LBR83_05950 [Clostridiales bacterium]|jgi:hypothetical protein|nr:hypothetical protein [Clostridiales bacterium]